MFLVGQQVLRFEVVKDAEEGFGVASDNGTLLFGTPATPRFARLAQRTVEGVVRDVFNVRKAETCPWPRGAATSYSRMTLSSRASMRFFAFTAWSHGATTRRAVRGGSRCPILARPMALS